MDATEHIFSDKQRILYLTEQMDAAGFIFNGMQVYDHMRVLEVCAAQASYVQVRVAGKDGSWFQDRYQFADVVREAINKLIRFKEFEQDCELRRGEDNLYSKQTGLSIPDEKRELLDLVHANYDELVSRGKPIGLVGAS